MSHVVWVGKSRIPTPTPKKRSWRSVVEALQRAREPHNQNLMACALLGGFLGIWLPVRYGLGWPGLVARFYHYDKNPVWQVEADKRDPKIGQVLTPTLFDFDGKRVALPAQQGLTVLAFTGNCTACATRDNMMAMEALQRKFPRLHCYIVIMSGDAKAARMLWQAGHISAPLLIDHDGDTASRFNAIFTFRRYVLDSRGHLLYLSDRLQSSNEIQRDIEKLVEAHGGG